MKMKLINGIPDDERLLAQAIAEARGRKLGFFRGTRGVDQDDSGAWVPCPQNRVCVLGALTLAHQRWILTSRVLGAAQGNDHRLGQRAHKDDKGPYFTLGSAFREEMLVDSTDDDDGWADEDRPQP